MINFGPKHYYDILGATTMENFYTFSLRAAINLSAVLAILASNVTASFAELISNTSKISPEEATSIAINSIQEEKGTIQLRNPNHSARFTSSGISYQQKNGPIWKWSLASIEQNSKELINAKNNSLAKPRKQNSTTIIYDRGVIDELYLAKTETIEQQFLIKKPISNLGGDLIIKGKVDCDAHFVPTPDGGGIWETSTDSVKFDTLRVFDANRKVIPSSMHVTKNETMLRIDGTALRTAAYPILVDPVIGANAIRISDMGPDGDANFGLINGYRRAVAYNSTNNEYLVVWTADDNTGSLVDGEWEIFGQRIDAATGAEVGTNDFRISDMGPDGDANYDANAVYAAYNSTNNEYLVVWSGDDNTAPQVDNEFEIFGQRLNAATGAEIGTNDFKISDMGTDGNITEAGSSPIVVYNVTNNEYLVVWRGDDDTAPLVNNEFEIFGQRLEGATGAEVGTNDFRISDMGPDGDINYTIYSLDAAYNSTNNEYFVTWVSEDNSGTLIDDEYEVFGQRLNASTGAELGTNDFRISDMGPDGNTSYDAINVSVAYSNLANEYLVVWDGDDNTGTLVDDKFEIFGQRLNAATGAETGTNDFRISDMGPDGNTAYTASTPSVVFNSVSNEYLVTWTSDDNTGSLVDNENEVYGQRLDGTTVAEIGDNDFRISYAGPDGNANYDALLYANLAWNSSNNQYLIAFGYDDNTAPLVDNENELYVQRYISAEANLSVAISDSPDPVTAGENVTYTITVTNNSSSLAYGVSAVTTLATGVTYQSASGTGWTCSASGQNVTCTRDSLAATTSSDILIVGSVATSVTGSIDCSVVISTSKSLDGTSSNDSASTSTTVNPPPADLNITLRSVKRKNNTVSGTILCSNIGQGPSAAFTARVFLSKNKTLETSKDTILKTSSVSALNAGAASSTIKFKKTVKKTPKKYYVIGYCDSAAAVSESNETNNTSTTRLK
jgi:uncharacterized repeat protein (TIGR01451 family)